MTILARPAASGVSATWAGIKAALARAIRRGIDARMAQTRRELAMPRTRRDDGFAAVRAIAIFGVLLAATVALRVLIWLPLFHANH